jgi:peptidyl-prolyl cis-trans isomerase C
MSFFKIKMIRVFLCLIVLVGLQASLLSAAQENVPPEKIVSVNGVVITQADYKQMLAMLQLFAEAQGRGFYPAENEKFREQMTQRLINMELFVQDALKKGIDVPTGLIDVQLSSFKKVYPGEGQFEAKLTELGLTEVQLRDGLNRQALINKGLQDTVIKRLSVNEEDVRAYYDNNIEQYREPEQVRARHILIKFAPDASLEEKTAARHKIEDIEHRLLIGDEFDMLAKEFSMGPSAVRGGDLGYFSQGRMVPAFDEAAFRLTPGELSPIIITQFGYHIIQVTDKKGSYIKPFDDVKNQIYSTLSRTNQLNSVNAYLDKLRAEADIKTLG